MLPKTLPLLPLLPLFLGTSPQLPRQAPYLVILEIRLQRDPGQRWGWDQVFGGALGLGLQGTQQGEAQPQET